MAIYDETETYLGKKVVSFTIDTKADDLQEGVVYRLDQDYEAEESQTELFAHFMATVEPSSVESLIIGEWSEAFDEDPTDYITALVNNKDKFSNLTAIYIGDMTAEQSEISWIKQTDYTPLLTDYPKLTSLKIRGSSDLELSAVEHDNLEELTIECGGLPASVLKAIAESKFPALKRLELWLGTDEYGFDGDIDDVKGLVEQINPSRLDYLGLKNSEIQDEVASFVAEQPWVADLDTLDLSMGTLKDTGAEALFNSEYVKSLKKLDLHYHFMSAEWQEKLKTLPCEVDVSDEQEPDDWDGETYYYISVAE